MVAGTLQPMGQPTRRYHLPSALRRSPLRLEPEAAAELVGAGALLIDVRRHDDPTATLEGALRIPPDELPARIARFARNTPIVLACT
jgi:rhodanese-related sulfurtransferase